MSKPTKKRPPKKATCVRLSDETLSKIEELSKKWGVTKTHAKSAVLERLVDEYAVRQE